MKRTLKLTSDKIRHRSKPGINVIKTKELSLTNVFVFVEGISLNEEKNPFPIKNLSQIDKISSKFFDKTLLRFRS